MEITQINIPHIPDLQALFGDAVQILDVEEGFWEFLKENWGWLLIGAAVIAFLFFVSIPSKKTKSDKPKEEPPITPFNQPVTYIQKTNSNDGQ